MSWRWSSTVTAILLASLSGGCASTLKDVAKEVTPEVVKGVAKGAADPDTQRLMVDALDEVHLKELSTRLSAGVLDGLLDSLEDPSRRARLEAILYPLAAKVAGVAVDSMLERAISGLEDPVRRERFEAVAYSLTSKVAEAAVETLLERTLGGLEDPARRARLEAIAYGLTSKIVGAAMDSALERALDEKVQARVRLAMRVTIADVVGVLLETVDAKIGTSQEWTHLFGAAAREIGKQATLGLQEALDDTRKDRETGKMPDDRGALLIAAGKASDVGQVVFWLLGIGAAVVMVGLGLSLVWAIRRNRLRRAELAQRDDALLLLAEAIKSSAAHPGAEGLHEALKRSMGDHPGGQHLRKLLGDQSSSD